MRHRGVPAGGEGRNATERLPEQHVAPLQLLGPGLQLAAEEADLVLEGGDERGGRDS